MIGILHGTELTFKEHGLLFLKCFIKIEGYVAEIRFNTLALCLDPVKDRSLIKRIRMIKVHEQSVLDGSYAGDLLFKDIVILIELIDLPSDLGILVGIKRSDTRFRGAE